jgi:hypothetical protein
MKIKGKTTTAKTKVGAKKVAASTKKSAGAPMPLMDALRVELRRKGSSREETVAVQMARRIVERADNGDREALRVLAHSMIAIALSL